MVTRSYWTRAQTLKPTTGAFWKGRKSPDAAHAGRGLRLGARSRGTAGLITKPLRYCNRGSPARKEERGDDDDGMG